MAKRFSPLEEVFPWRRDFLLSAEGFFPWREGFSLGEGFFPLGERVSPRLSGEFFTRGREIFEGFSLGERIFSPWLRFFPWVRDFLLLATWPLGFLGRGGRPPSFGEDPWRRACRPLSGTGRGGEDLTPTPVTPLLPGGLIGLYNADVFPKNGPLEAPGRGVAVGVTPRTSTRAASSGAPGP